ncbi:unnamed protein product, partial [marine sediment metagenome]
PAGQNEKEKDKSDSTGAEQNYGHGRHFYKIDADNE